MNILNTIKNKFKKREAASLQNIGTHALIIPRKKHNVSRSDIHDYAITILQRLNKAGFEAYLVGGCVRDLLLEKNPKDFDLATDATPEEIKHIFRNCRLIGRRFRLAHIYHKTDIFEVATFRGSHADTDTHGEEGRILRDNVYGTMEEDAYRRDFTVNALYYTLKNFCIVDYLNGVEDLKTKTLRIIGDPEKRYREDPVRLLRAIRFMSKLNFTLSPETEKPIKELRELIANVPSARLFHEMLKMFHGGHALANFHNLRRYELLDMLLPEVNALIEKQHPHCRLLLETAFNNTDERLKTGKTVSPVFLFAFLLWYPMLEYYDRFIEEDNPHHAALDLAMQIVLKEQNKVVNIPKRLSQSIKEVWRLQFILEKITRRRVRIHRHPRFRAAYDLLLLRNDAKEPLNDTCQWWTEFVEATKPQPHKKPRRKSQQGRRKTKK